MTRKVPEVVKDRARALEVLREYRKGRRLDYAISDALTRETGPGSPFVTELASGVVRQLARLDHHLLFFCRKASSLFPLMYGTS